MMKCECGFIHCTLLSVPVQWRDSLLISNSDWRAWCASARAGSRSTAAKTITRKAGSERIRPARTTRTRPDVLIRVGVAKPDLDCLAVGPGQRLEEGHRRAVACLVA